MRILNGRLRALTEEILVFWIGVRLWAVVADERWSHIVHGSSTVSVFRPVRAVFT